MVESEERGRTLAVVLNRDLMFGSRIRSAMDLLGLEATFARDTDTFVAALKGGGDAVAIALVDMNGPVVWETVTQALRGDADAPPTLAFGPHVDVEARRAAKAAGVSRIVSNGQFHSDAKDLIDRYRRR